VSLEAGEVEVAVGHDSGQVVQRGAFRVRGQRCEVWTQAGGSERASWL